MEPSEEQIFLCPYCGSENSLAIDYSAGEEQEFVSECEMCCKPIVVKIRLENMDVADFRVEKENE